MIGRIVLASTRRSALVFSRRRGKGERGDKESDERSKGAICLRRYFLSQRDAAKMQTSKVSTRGKRDGESEWPISSMTELCVFIIRTNRIM